MGETIRYIESDGTSHQLNTTNVRYVTGEGLDSWPTAPMWDVLTGDTSRLAGYDIQARKIVLTFAISADTYDHARGTVATWRPWFYRDVARGSAGTLQVVLDNGGTYSIEAALSQGNIAEPVSITNIVKIELQTSSQFWLYGAASSTASAFAGTAIVYVTYNNTGDAPAYPVHLITGIVGTPKILDVGTGKYLQIGTATAGTADTLTIYTNPVHIDYSAGGTGAIQRYAGYAGTVSTFFGLPMGAGTLQLSAASGSATYTLTYGIRKAGLG